MGVGMGGGGVEVRMAQLPCNCERVVFIREVLSFPRGLGDMDVGVFVLFLFFNSLSDDASLFFFFWFCFWVCRG